jgi:hypothetical protein
MRYKSITSIFFLLCASVMATAQTLSEKFNKKNPMVVVCQEDKPYAYLNVNGKAEGCYVDIINALAGKFNVPCRFVIDEGAKSKALFDSGKADLILTDWHIYCNQPSYLTSQTVVGYNRISADSVAEIHFIGKDKYLIDELDDEFMRLRLDGHIAAIQDRWLHPERTQPLSVPATHYITFVALAISVLLCILCIWALWKKRRATRHTSELNEMIRQAQLISQQYAVEDNQPSHDIAFRHDAMLSNPFVAISFYDEKGQLIMQNEPMKQLGTDEYKSFRKPLYNSEGLVACYFVAVAVPKPTV